MASYRKHNSQLTQAEKGFLWKKLYDVGSMNWEATKHLLDMIYERGGDYDDVVNTIYNGYIVEYHQKDRSNRILVRGTKSYRGSVLCVVFEPDTRRVITAYWNEADDQHRTIDMRAYIENLDAVSSWKNEHLVFAS